MIKTKTNVEDINKLTTKNLKMTIITEVNQESQSVTEGLSIANTLNTYSTELEHDQQVCSQE